MSREGRVERSLQTLSCSYDGSITFDPSTLAANACCLKTIFSVSIISEVELPGLK